MPGGLKRSLCREMGQPGIHPLVITWCIQYQTQNLIFVARTHTGIAAGVGRAFSRVCLFVRALTGKWLKLLTPNLVHICSTAVVWHALTQRSKGEWSRSHGYENRHGGKVTSDHVPYSVYQHAAVLPAAVATTWVCMSIRLPMFCWL